MMMIDSVYFTLIRHSACVHFYWHVNMCEASRVRRRSDDRWCLSNLTLFAMANAGFQTREHQDAFAGVDPAYKSTRNAFCGGKSKFNLIEHRTVPAAVYPTTHPVYCVLYVRLLRRASSLVWTASPAAGYEWHQWLKYKKVESATLERNFGPSFQKPTQYSKHRIALRFCRDWKWARRINQMIMIPRILC